MLANEEQEFIKAEVPMLYSFILGEDMSELGEFGVIVGSLQKLILTTLGKMCKYDSQMGDKNDQGQEVLYSVSIPANIDFFMKIAVWAKEKGEEFENSEEVQENPIGAIGDALKEFNDLLESADYKESISFNSFVTIIKEDGKEKVFLNIKADVAKMKMLEKLDM